MDGSGVRTKVRPETQLNLTRKSGGRGPSLDLMCQVQVHNPRPCDRLNSDTHIMKE